MHIAIEMCDIGPGCPDEYDSRSGTPAFFLIDREHDPSLYCGRPFDMPSAHENLSCPIRTFRDYRRYTILADIMRVFSKGSLKLDVMYIRALRLGLRTVYTVALLQYTCTCQMECLSFSTRGGAFVVRSSIVCITHI